jgi:hypothetical protein
MKIVLAILAVSSTAIAAPCDVRIVRAPDGVGARIEAAVAAEPACSRALELRVIEVRDGLYLFARDDRGRVHERLVPDAESAGVLVASWAADNSFVPPSEFDIVPPDFDDDPVVVEDEEEPRRSVATTTYEDDVEQAPARSTTRPPHYLAVGFLTGDGGKTRGVRAELDVYAGSHWTLGVAAQSSASELASATSQSQYEDRQLTMFVARAYRGTKWFGRAGAGIGFTSTSGIRSSSEQYATTLMRLDGDGVVVEGFLDVSRKISKRWAIGLGLLAQRYSQSFQTENLYSYSSSPYADMVTLSRDELAVSFLGALKVGL